jgi:hypothetical protein
MSFTKWKKADIYNTMCNKFTLNCFALLTKRRVKIKDILMIYEYFLTSIRKQTFSGDWKYTISGNEYSKPWTWKIGIVYIVDSIVMQM